MCNIAGYIGQHKAAPILLGMLRREEGYAGGYYSGIATWHEGRLHAAKLTGDVARLIEKTDAASLPGTVGIIHSRSKSGGGDEWAHPFLGHRNGTPAIAYVANGSIGKFRDCAPAFDALAQELFDSGYDLPSRVRIESSRYNTLRDGTVAHMSDVMCQLILRYMDKGTAEDAAMEAAFCRMPSEIVGLLLSTAAPDRIFWSRINMPMFVAAAPHGMYLASSPTAFPDDAGTPTLLPQNSAGYVSETSFTSHPFAIPPTEVAPLDGEMRESAYRAVCDRLSAGEPLPLSALTAAVKPLFPLAETLPATAAVYGVLYRLQKEGRLREENRRVPGAAEGLDAPRTYFSLLPTP